MNVDWVLESAEGVARGKYAPMYKRAEYEDAMLEIAKRDAREGESTATAFARLCDEGDDRVESLYYAARAADEDVRLDMFKRTAPGGVAPNEQQAMSVRQKAMEDMMRLARRRKRDDETDEQAFARLVREGDTDMGKLCKRHLEA